MEPDCTKHTQPCPGSPTWAPSKGPHSRGSATVKCQTACLHHSERCLPIRPPVLTVLLPRSRGVLWGGWGIVQEQEEAAPPAYDDRSSICTQSQCHPSKFRALGTDTILSQCPRLPAWRTERLCWPPCSPCPRSRTISNWQVHSGPATVLTLV